MKKLLSICFPALAFAAAAISAPQLHHAQQIHPPVTINDTVPGKNKLKSTDSAKEWHNNADDVRDTLFPRRDSSGHPHLKDTSANSLH